MLATVTRFPKLRLAARIAAVVLPLGLFISLLLCAAGMLLWAIIPATISTLVLVVLFPFFQPNAETSRKDPKTRWLLGRIAGLLAFYWLLFRTDLIRLVEHAIDSHALFDWRLIAAAALWTVSGIMSLLKRINESTDQEVYSRLKT